MLKKKVWVLLVMMMCAIGFISYEVTADKTSKKNNLLFRKTNMT